MLNDAVADMFFRQYLHKLLLTFESFWASNPTNIYLPKAACANTLTKS